MKLRALLVGFSLAALATLAVGCDRLPGRPLEEDRYERPSEILDFDALYAQNCSGCHGAEGRMGPSRPLADPLYLALADADIVAQVVSHGVAGSNMPAFALRQGGMLTDAQVSAIATGLFERWADPAGVGAIRLPPYSAADSLAAGNALGDPKRGAAAFESFCAECHGAEGRGGEDAGSVVNGSFLALVSDQMLRTSVIAGRADLDMPDWRKASKTRAMTDQEISDVVAWMASKRVPFPGRPHAAAGGGASGRRGEE